MARCEATTSAIGRVMKITLYCCGGLNQEAHITSREGTGRYLIAGVQSSGVRVDPSPNMPSDCKCGVPLAYDRVRNSRSGPKEKSDEWFHPAGNEPDVHRNNESPCPPSDPPRSCRARRRISQPARFRDRAKGCLAWICFHDSDRNPGAMRKKRRLVLPSVRSHFAHHSHASLRGAEA